jgi:hypothetical protein
MMMLDHVTNQNFIQEEIECWYCLVLSCPEPVVFLRMPSSEILHHVALVRTDISEELSASIIRVTRIGELGTLAVTSN